MKIDKKQIYWITISAFLTLFGAYELYQLFNTFIYESRATKTSTLTMDGKILSESLGITICTSLRPNMTYLKEHNISENVFNYALSFYHTDGDLEIEGNQSLLRLQLVDVLYGDITHTSLKNFFQMTAMKSTSPASFYHDPLRLRDTTYHGSAICNQYALENQSGLSWFWLEEGNADVNISENFVVGDQNTRSAFISIFYYDNIYHPVYSDAFISLQFRKNVAYFSKLNVQATKYVRKLNCKPTPSRFIMPINRAKFLCLEICSELINYDNCSRASEVFSEISKQAPLCKFSFKIANVSEKNGPLRQCLNDYQCNEAHYCTEWAFDMNLQSLKGNEKKIKNVENETGEGLGLHYVSVYFLPDSYLIEEVEIMTIDMLLANVGGLLGLLCGFELIMAARFFYKRCCILFAAIFQDCFRFKNPRVASDFVDRNIVGTEVQRNYFTYSSREHLEERVKEISQV